MNTHDIELPEHDCLYESTNEQGYIDLEPAYRKSTVLRLLEADRQRRGEPVAWIQRSYLNLIRESNTALHNVVVRGSILDGDGDVVPLFTAPQPAEPVKLDRYDAGYLGGQDGMPAYVWHDIIRSELDRAYDFYMDQLDRAAPQPAEPVSAPKHLIERLQKHSEDKSNTAFARSTMREALQYLTAEPCVSSVSDKTACGSANGDCDSQPAEPVKHKRQYAQGTALGEFGIIPMCDQVDDEPMKTPKRTLDDILFADQSKAETQAAFTDAITTGTGFLLEGKRVDPKDIYMAEPVKVPSDADILELWTGDPTHSRPVMGKNKVIAFARALLDRYGQQAQPAASAEPNDRDAILAAARHAGWSFAKYADGVIHMIPLVSGEAQAAPPAAEQAQQDDPTPEEEEAWRDLEGRR